MTKHPIKNQRKQSVVITNASEAGTTFACSALGGWLVRRENGVPWCMAAAVVAHAGRNTRRMGIMLECLKPCVWKNSCESALMRSVRSVMRLKPRSLEKAMA